jgi:tripartite-type tricarboxylate transporter receptor subunit TctC
MKLHRWFLACIGTAIAATSAVLLAQSYPTKPIRLIVPLAPGSTADIGSRYAAQELSKALRQPVVVENRPGAGGSIGTAELARAAPDGYTIGFASQGTLVFNQAFYTKPGYNSLTGFAPIALLGRASDVMVVQPSNSASRVTDIIAVAKAKPGTLTFASGGRGTSHHLAGVLFSRATGIDLVHVPYKSTPQAVLAVMRNEVTMGFFNIPIVIGQIKDGKLKALGVTSLTRSPLLPGVPTLDEQGLKGYEVDSWGGFVAPAGTPPEIVNRLNAALVRIFTSAEAREKLEPQGFELAPPLSPGAFSQLIADDLTTWIPVVKASGAKAN